MAINVQYGDISSALGLALQGGQAVRQRQQQQNDMQFLDLVGNEQARADAAHAQEVSQALGVQKSNADLQMEQRKMDEASQHNVADEGLKQQQIKAQQQEAQDREAQSAALNAQTHQFQQSDHDMKAQTFADKQKTDQEKADAIATLTPEQQSVVKATGRMPYVPNNQGDPDSAAYKLLEAESRRMDGEIKQREAVISKTVEGQLGTAPPNPELINLQQQKAAIDGEIQKRTQGLIANGTLNSARIAQQALAARSGGTPGAPGQPQQTPQAAPGSQGPLSNAQAIQFLQQAGGDKAKARQLAIQAGYSIPQ